MIEEVKLEKIETTYGDFFKMTKDNPDDIYYIETHKGEFTPIYAAAEKEVNQMYTIEFDDGYKIECADEHVLMDKAGNELYVKDIVKNKRVMSKYGTKTVKSIRKTNSKIAYDINIDAPHWYVNDENGLIHHNTLLGLVCMKAYLDKHPNGIAILYDSEFGITPAYLKSIGIDTTRVLHIPILNIEELKFDMTQRLKELKKSDDVYILIDSLGNLASLKEATDAEDGKSVQDMSRAKQIKSFFRIITPHFTLKDIPCVVVNHVYDGQGLFAKKVVSGGCVVAGTEIQTPDGLKKVEDFEVGDNVNTLSGPLEVTHVWDPETLEEGNPECYEITFEDGYTVTVSDKHMFLIDGKWVQAKDLVEGLVCTTLDP